MTTNDRKPTKKIKEGDENPMNIEVFDTVSLKKNQAVNLHAVQEKTRLSCKLKSTKRKKNANEFGIKMTKKCKFMHTSNQENVI